MNYLNFGKAFLAFSLTLGTKSCSEVFYTPNSTYKIVLSTDGQYLNISHKDRNGNFLSNLNLSVNSVGLDGGTLNIALVEKGKSVEISRFVFGISERLKIMREYYQSLELRENAQGVVARSNTSPIKEGR